LAKESSVVKKASSTGKVIGWTTASVEGAGEGETELVVTGAEFRLLLSVTHEVAETSKEIRRVSCRLCFI
jgi:hypothetical protein